MTAIAGALGSVIGYVGAEVAEPEVFERLLWPQRFYNYLSPSTMLTTALTMPMGGPMHRAALETLDSFRKNGLYRGRCRGNMLGTAFYEKKENTYVCRTGGSDNDKEVRNGFWVGVLEMIDQRKLKTILKNRLPPDMIGGQDAETQDPSRVWRATQILFILKITGANAPDSFRGKGPKSPALPVNVREDRITPQTIGLLLLSELSTLTFAVVVGAWQRVFWLTGFFCVPLFLKLLALAVSVPRERLSFTQLESPTKSGISKSARASGDDILHGSEQDASKSQGSAEATPILVSKEIYEVRYPSIGFALLEGHPSHIRPFFKHYAHPIRIRKSDRFREICCIMLIYMFVLYFPAGLLALLWMNPVVQYLWLGYQVYAIIAMHVARLFGFGGSGRTEERVARLLENGRKVCLQSGSAKVWVELEMEEVGSVSAGQRRISEIVEKHRKSGQLTDNSNAPLGGTIFRS